MTASPSHPWRGGAATLKFVAGDLATHVAAPTPDPVLRGKNVTLSSVSGIQFHAGSSMPIQTNHASEGAPAQ